MAAMFFVTVFKFHLILFVLLAHIRQTPAKKCSLYSPDDPIACMEGDEVDKLVVNSESCWAVEFYSSWCGHCHNFAPTFKAVARDVSKWGGIMKIGVIDCSLNNNQAICRAYNINGYPTVKLIHAKTEDPRGGKLFVGGRSANEVKLSYLDLIASQPNPSSSWPDLTSLSFGNYLRLESRNPNKPTVLAFSDPKSSFAKELVVRFMGKQDIVVRTVIDDPVMSSHMSVDTHSLPAVVAIRSKERTILQKPSEQNEEEVVDFYYKQINQWMNGNVTDTKKLPRAAPVKTSSPFQAANVTLASLSDLLSTVGFALYNEVPMHAMINGPTLGILTEFVMLLEQVFVRLMPEASAGLKKLTQDLHIAKAKSFVSRRDWVKMIQQGVNPDMQVFSGGPQWHGCKGTSSEYRGYPCGLWNLMHTATILSHPVINQLPRSKPTHQNIAYNSLDALRIMSAFVANFFTCQDCREHFVKMSSSVDSLVKNNADAVLWLWCAHNVVNGRTAGTLSEDPGYPKVQYPDSQTCSKCHWSATNTDRTFDTRCQQYQLADENHPVKWNEHEVMLHLCQVYGKEHVAAQSCVLLATSADVGRHQIPTEVSRQQRHGNPSNTQSTGSSSFKCYFIVFLCFALLLFLFGKFRRRLPRLVKMTAYHSHLM